MASKRHPENENEAIKKRRFSEATQEKAMLFLARAKLTANSKAAILLKAAVCADSQNDLKREMVPMSFEQIVAMLGLFGGCIYATLSIAIKVFALLQQKKKD